MLLNQVSYVMKMQTQLVEEYVSDYEHVSLSAYVLKIKYFTQLNYFILNLITTVC